MLFSVYFSHPCKITKAAKAPLIISPISLPIKCFTSGHCRPPGYLFKGQTTCPSQRDWKASLGTKCGNPFWQVTDIWSWTAPNCSRILWTGKAPCRVINKGSLRSIHFFKLGQWIFQSISIHFNAKQNGPPANGTISRIFGAIHQKHRKGFTVRWCPFVQT